MTTTLAREGATDRIAEPIPVLGLGDVQTLTIGDSADTSTPCPAGVTAFTFAWSVSCHIYVGPPGTDATTSHTYRPGAAWDYLKIQEGWIVSVIGAADNEEDGFMTVTWSV